MNKSNRWLWWLCYLGPKVFIIVPIGVALGLLLLLSARWTEKFSFAQFLPGKRRLGLALAALILTPLICGNLKKISNTYCPYDIVRYGGHAPYVRVFEPYPEEFARYQQASGERGHGFPAGHASGGFALMSLCLLSNRRRTQCLLIAGASLLGWWMGGYQMVRGAHYLSHTLVTWAIAALVISSLRAFFPGKISSAPPCAAAKGRCLERENLESRPGCQGGKSGF